MGKTPKPLTLLVHPDLRGHEKIVEYEKMQHVIVWMDNVGIIKYDGDAVGGIDVSRFDLILGPNCWRMTPTLMKHADLAVKGARAEKYPIKKAIKAEAKRAVG